MDATNLAAPSNLVRPAAQELIKDLAGYAGLLASVQINTFLAERMRTDNPALDKLITAIQCDDWYSASELLPL